MLVGRGSGRRIIYLRTPAGAWRELEAAGKFRQQDFDRQRDPAHASPLLHDDLYASRHRPCRYSDHHGRRRCWRAFLLHSILEPGAQFFDAVKADWRLH